MQDDAISCGVFACFHAINAYDDEGISCDPIKQRTSMAFDILQLFRAHARENKKTLPLVKWPTDELLKKYLKNILQDQILLEQEEEAQKNRDRKRKSIVVKRKASGSQDSSDKEEEVGKGGSSVVSSQLVVAEPSSKKKKTSGSQDSSDKEEEVGKGGSSVVSSQTSAWGNTKLKKVSEKAQEARKRKKEETTSDLYSPMAVNSSKSSSRDSNIYSPKSVVPIPWALEEDTSGDDEIQMPSSNLSVAARINELYIMCKNLKEQLTSQKERIHFLESRESRGKAKASSAKHLIPAIKDYVTSTHGAVDKTNYYNEEEFVDFVVQKKNDENILNDSIEEVDRGLVIAEIRGHDKYISQQCSKNRSKLYMNIKKLMMEGINVLNVAFGSCLERFEHSPYTVLRSLNDQELENVALNEKKSYIRLITNLLFNTDGLRQWAVDLFKNICTTLGMVLDVTSFGMIIAVSIYSDMQNKSSRLNPTKISKCQDEWALKLDFDPDESTCVTAESYVEEITDSEGHVIVRTDDTYSFSEVRRRADESVNRYLIYKCNDIGTCRTIHSTCCKLSGIEVSKLQEGKLAAAESLERQPKEKQSHNEGSEMSEMELTTRAHEEEITVDVATVDVALNDAEESTVDVALNDSEESTVEANSV